MRLLVLSLGVAAGLRAPEPRTSYALPEYASVVGAFGRLAEHKALGFTSSYSACAPSRLALWLPTRWSRRLRVDRPDWKRLFEGARSVDRAAFDARLQALPFKYPAECPVPSALAGGGVQTGATGEELLRLDPSLVLALEQRLQGTPIAPRVLEALFFLLGGRDELLVADNMEACILEWGMRACRDDPVVDFPAFDDALATRLTYAPS